MRRFKLLRDLPDCKVGEIGEDDQSGNVNWRTILSKPDFSRARYLSYPLAFVEAKRDWFEEVKEEPKDNKIYVGISKCCNKPAYKCTSKMIPGGEDCPKFKCSGCDFHCDIYTPSEPVKKLGEIYDSNVFFTEKLINSQITILYNELSRVFEYLNAGR